MNFFNIFKKEKKEPKGNSFMEKIQNELFPEGKPQIEAETEQLYQSLNERYIKDQIHEIFLYTSALVHISPDITQESIVGSIMRRPNNRLSEEDAKKVYLFVARKHYGMKQTIDSEEGKKIERVFFGDDNGCFTDEMPDAYGEFGLEPTNPVPVRGIIGNRAYLGKLRTADGQPITWTRDGSTHSQNIGKTIDIYTITNSQAQPIARLYICPYNSMVSRKIPKGFMSEKDFIQRN